MADEIMRERERIINTFPNIPPQPFRVGDIVIRQPSEREIYLKQITVGTDSLPVRVRFSGQIYILKIVRGSE